MKKINQISISQIRQMDPQRIQTGTFRGLGTFVSGNAITFAAALPEGKEAVLLLYKKGHEQVDCCIPLPVQPWMGDVRCIRVEGITAAEYEYNYMVDGEIIPDPAARIVTGREPFGSREVRSPHRIRCGFLKEGFDWGGDAPPAYAYQDVIAYYLHVRGFTASPASRVRHPGTFRGLQEKIPYLEKLGINQVILMPACEFEELILPERAHAVHQHGQSAHHEHRAHSEEKAAIWSDAKVNYWGYAPSWYYAPKKSYSSSPEPDVEFKELVKALHRRKIELVMELAFPDGTDPAFLEDVLRFWVQEYHVDGFRLLCNDCLAGVAALSPLLRKVKIISGYFDLSREQLRDPVKSSHLADFNDGFRNDCRKLLKGDENMLGAFSGRMSAFCDEKGILNAITGHDGFTLRDLVSYDGKHNEENGENNQDGAPSEFSWNCGAEGMTRKRAIRELRLRQMKNAFAMLLLGQGTPVLLAGDEHGNTQLGNSNPYCIDSEVTYLDWNRDVLAKDLTAFVAQLIALRKSHILLRGITKSRADTGGPGGYPVFSCHGSRAWYASEGYQERHIGFMYCGRENGEDTYLYLAFNLHWEEQELALPYLPEGMEWRTVLSTGTEAETGGNCRRSVKLPGRTVLVLEGVKNDGSETM